MTDYHYTVFVVETDDTTGTKKVFERRYTPAAMYRLFDLIKDFRAANWFPEVLEGLTDDQISAMTEQINLRHLVDTYQNKIVNYALQKCDGNITHAAKLLSTKRTTLQELIKRQAIE